MSFSFNFSLSFGLGFLPRLNFSLSHGFNFGFLLRFDFGLSLGLVLGFLLRLDFGLSLGFSLGFLLGLDFGLGLGFGLCLLPSLYFGLGLGFSLSGEFRLLLLLALQLFDSRFINEFDGFRFFHTSFWRLCNAVGLACFPRLAPNIGLDRRWAHDDSLHNPGLDRWGWHSMRVVMESKQQKQQRMEHQRERQWPSAQASGT